MSQNEYQKYVERVFFVGMWKESPQEMISRRMD